MLTCGRIRRQIAEPSTDMTDSEHDPKRVYDEARPEDVRPPKNCQTLLPRQEYTGGARHASAWADTVQAGFVATAPVACP